MNDRLSATGGRNSMGTAIWLLDYSGEFGVVKNSTTLQAPTDRVALSYNISNNEFLVWWSVVGQSATCILMRRAALARRRNSAQRPTKD